MRPLDLMLIANGLRPKDGPGSVNGLCRNLAIALGRLGHRVHLVSLVSKSVPPQCLRLGPSVKLSFVDSAAGFASLPDLFGTPAIVHAFDWNSADEARHSADHWGVPLFASPLSLPVRPTRENQDQADLEERVAAAAKLLPSPSWFAASKTIVRCGIEARKAVVIPPGVDTETFRPLHPGENTPAETYVIAADRKSRKRADFWINLVGSIPESQRPVLALTGKWGNTAVKMAADAGVTVWFLAPASQEEFAATLRGAAAVIIPNADAVSLLALEAQASGVPVLVGAEGGASEVVIDGETGYIVDNLDPARWSEPVLAVLRNRKESVRLGKAGRENAKVLDWDLMAGRLEDLYYANRNWG